MGIAKEYGYLPLRFAAGDIVFDYVWSLNGWYLYRVTPVQTRFQVLRWEVFTPEYIEIHDVDENNHNVIAENYPPEGRFETKNQAYRFDSLLDALDFIESCEKVIPPKIKDVKELKRKDD